MVRQVFAIFVKLLDHLLDLHIVKILDDIQSVETIHKLESLMAILGKDTLRIIMVGATHVVDMGGKTAFIHYETETTAHMLLPDGTRYDGNWSLLDDGYRVEWTQRSDRFLEARLQSRRDRLRRCDRRGSRPRLAHRVRRGRAARRRKLTG